METPSPSVESVIASVIIRPFFNKVSKPYDELLRGDMTLDSLKQQMIVFAAGFVDELLGVKGENKKAIDRMLSEAGESRSVIDLVMADFAWVRISFLEAFKNAAQQFGVDPNRLWVHFVDAFVAVIGSKMSAQAQKPAESDRPAGEAIQGTPVSAQVLKVLGGDVETVVGGSSFAGGQARVLPEGGTKA